MFNMLRACVNAYTTQALSFEISKIDKPGYSEEYYIVVELVLKETGADLHKFVETDLQTYLNELFGHCFGDLKIPPEIGDVFVIDLTTCFWKDREVDLATQFPELEYKLQELVNLNYYLEKLRAANSWQNYFGFSQAGFVDKLPITNWLERWVEPVGHTYYTGSVLVNLQTNSASIKRVYSNRSTGEHIKPTEYINQGDMRITPGSQILNSTYLLIWKGVVYAASSVGIYGVCVNKNVCSSTALMDWTQAYTQSNNSNDQIIYRISWAVALQKYQRADNKISNLGLVLALASLHNSPEVLIFEQNTVATIRQIYKLKYPINCEYQPTPLRERHRDYFSDLVGALESDSLFATTAIWAELVETEAEYLAHQQLYSAQA